MIVKQCQFASRDEDGEYLHVLRVGYDNSHLVKLAAASPPQLGHIQRFMKGLPKSDGVLHTLVSALGAGEYWGSNSNADYFGEEPLLHIPPGWDQLSQPQQKIVGARWEWGYPTFYNAHAFAHHQNKDPNRAFGSIEYVMWDPNMKRVLLIVAFDRARARRLGSSGVIDRVENGEFPMVSMGCKVPFDLCSRCADLEKLMPMMGQPARILAMHRQKPIRGVSATTHEYCHHLKSELNKIYPDGVQVKMLNMHPRFFDLSVVWIGADKTSFILAKLGSECPLRPGHKQCPSGCYECAIPSSHVHDVWDREKTAMSSERHLEKRAYGLEEFDMEDFPEDPKTEREINRILKRNRTRLGRVVKTGDLGKGAEIVKQIKSNFRKALSSIQNGEPDIPKEVQDKMSEDLPSSLSTAGSMGIVIKPREFQRMSICSLGRPGLADELDSKGLMFRTGAPPSRDFGLSGEIIPSILKALLPILGARSALGPSLNRRTIIIVQKSPGDRMDHFPVRHLEGHPLLDKISADYSAYRRDLLYKSAGLIKRALDNYSDIPYVLYDSDLDPRGLVKEGRDVMESMIGMLTSMYINEAYMDQPVSKYVGEHSDLAGLQKAGGLAMLGGVA